MDLLPQYTGTMGESFYNQTVSKFFNYSNVSETNLLAHNDILFKEYPPALLIFASISCVIFIILGVPGNLITIIALARCKKVRNATAVFIINLSLSDLLFCCFNLPLQASTFYHRQWIHGPLLCRLFPLLRYGLLAVSLFTILAITINRYIMIGHPRIYPRIYRRKFLAVMVALTWIGAFGALIPTWRGTWGKFGLDRTIGSCSILHVNNVSPKEFLFIMAFALPCLSIVVCYARIFYIVRKTAMKINEPSTNNKIVGSIKMTHNHATYHNNNNGQYKNSILMPPSSNQLQELKEIQRQNSEQEKSNEGHRLSFADEQDEMKLSRNNSQRSSRTKKLLKRTKEEELKFIDTSIESDLPPTLSSLQRKLLNTQSPIHESNPTSPLTVTVTNEQERVGSISKAVENAKNVHDNCVDSAVEESIISQENPVCNAHDDHQNELQSNHMLNVQMEPSSSSGIELPYDHESPEKIVKNSLVSTHKVKKRKLKNCSNNVKDINRKKSAANTSGASIMYVGRMTSKDRRLLKMILVIFISFLICYLPITLTKINKELSRVHFLNVMGYLLVYLTTCINPIIYVVMSSEYRQAYWNLLMCRINNGNGSAAKVNQRRA